MTQNTFLTKEEKIKPNHLPLRIYLHIYTYIFDRKFSVANCEEKLFTVSSQRPQEGQVDTVVVVS